MSFKNYPSPSLEQNQETISEKLHKRFIEFENLINSVGGITSDKAVLGGAPNINIGDGKFIIINSGKTTNPNIVNKTFEEYRIYDEANKSVIA